MMSDDLVKSTSINVDVYNGIAYLKGNVENDSQKRMAADLTRGVEGVIRVENLLVVKRTTP
jgi:hyperosmotically inducible protein